MHVVDMLIENQEHTENEMLKIYATCTGTVFISRLFLDIFTTKDKGPYIYIHQ